MKKSILITFILISTLIGNLNAQATVVNPVSDELSNISIENELSDIILVSEPTNEIISVTNNTQLQAVIATISSTTAIRIEYTRNGQRHQIKLNQ